MSAIDSVVIVGFGILLWWMIGFIGGVIYAINRKLFFVCVVVGAGIVLVLALWGLALASDETTEWRWETMLGGIIGGFTISIPFSVAKDFVERMRRSW